MKFGAVSSDRRGRRPNRRRNVMDFKPAPLQVNGNTRRTTTFSWTHLLIKLTSRKFMVVVGVVVGCLIRLFHREAEPDVVDRCVLVTCAVGAVLTPLVYVLVEGGLDRARALEEGGKR